MPEAVPYYDQHFYADVRCGHNYEPSNCPYAHCGYKKALDELERLRAALETYALVGHWQCPRCHGSDVANCFMGRWKGPGNHGYDVARKALSAEAEAIEGLAEMERPKCPACVTRTHEPMEERDIAKALTQGLEDMKAGRITSLNKIDPTFAQEQTGAVDESGHEPNKSPCSTDHHLDMVAWPHTVAASTEHNQAEPSERERRMAEIESTFTPDVCHKLIGGWHVRWLLSELRAVERERDAEIDLRGHAEYQASFWEGVATLAKEELAEAKTALEAECTVNSLLDRVQRELAETRAECERLQRMVDHE